MAAALHLTLRRRRRRQWLLILVAAISSYGAYRLYHLPSVARKRRQLSRLAAALHSLANAAASSADTLTLLTSDLNSFLRSDSDDLPCSLKQFSKITASPEFSASISSVSHALTLGIARGFGSAFPETNSTPSFSDRVIDKLASPSGSGVVSVVVGSFARNLVMAFYSTGGGRSFSSESEQGWIGLICSNDKCRELIADSIQQFVSTAVTVYLDRTLDINTYDELFSGLTNPKHEMKLREILVSVCNGAVDTLVRTSHQVLTISDSASSSKEVEEFSIGTERSTSVDVKARISSGWVDQVSSTLAVPSNRRFVLDVAGQVTFATVRSFLEFTMSKLYDGTKRGVNSVREDVVEKGLEVVRYVSAKSMAIYAICIALCMRMLTGTRILMPA